MSDLLFDLTGKIAIVTGASRGLGRAIAIGLAKAGANLVVTDVLDVSGTVEEIQSIGREAAGLKVDVSKKKDVEEMTKQTINKFGRIDILVNNAGIYRSAPAESMSEEDWDKVIDINLKGEFLCAQEVGKQMIRQREGKIINIASVAGRSASPQSAAYNASKAGVILLTKTLAVEWAKHNVQVNAICPGVFFTPMTEGLIEDERFLNTLKKDVPMARPGVPEEIVGAVIFLTSKASSYVTGHALVVDGGWTAAL
ncbi:MAG: glucose 1-dehydrogenase [Thaumarchaeota archaeon]|nr:glucose 1-dehydrogenase [Nitrososphaerota archaeon]MCL5318948.1 glucose 1-dehydrogenase [Nitrososphaerota archaeon]